ncbi:MAG: CbiQ family ECF transporter T component [Paracoccaceae bacterium]
MIALTSPVDTPFHRIPAGAKLAFLCLFTTALYLPGGIAWPLAGIGFVATLYAVGGPVFARAGLAALRPLWPFVLLVGLYHLWAGKSAEGAALLLRVGAVLGLANLVTMTTRLDRMMAVLRGLLRPFRRFGLNPRAVELAMALAIRFTPVLILKGRLLAEAWRARSPHRRASWRIAAPLAALALDDADHVAEALRARGGL